MSESLLTTEQIEEAVGKEGVGLFASLSEPLDDAGLDSLRHELDEYLDNLDSVKKLYKDLDMGLAERLGRACYGLLDACPGLDTIGVAAVVGAVRYFIEPGDAVDDVWTAGGLDDDARLVDLVIDATEVHVKKVNP